MSNHNDTGAPTPRYFVVSSLTFIAWWWYIFLAHLINGFITLCFGVIYLFFSQPQIYYNIAGLSIPAPILRLSGWTCLGGASIHFVSLFGIMRASLSSRELAFARRRRFRPKSNAPSRTSSIRVHYNNLTRKFLTVFGRNGFLGINGKYFEVVYSVREVIELCLQTWQAYELSRLVPRHSVNAAAVAVITVNCLGSPLIHFGMHGSDDTKRRLAMLTMDALLDFCWAVTIPIAVIMPMVVAFQPSTGVFPPELVFNDVWVTGTISQVQQFMITSMSDYVSSLMPHLTIVLSLRLSSKLIRRQRTAIDPASIVPNAHKRPSPIPSDIPSQRQPFRGRKAVLTTGILLAWCSVVIGIHVHMFRLQPDDPQCRLRVHRWFARQAPCAVLQINCYRKQIEGSSDEIAAILMQTDPKSLRRLIITHCPRLEIPPALKDMSGLSDLDIFNCTLSDWPSSAAITQDNHPIFSQAYIVESNLTRYPDGLAHHELPPSFIRLYIVRTNLTDLPEDFGDYWQGQEFDALSVQHSPLRALPSSFNKVRTRKLRLIDTLVSNIPEGTFDDQTFFVLHLSANPIESLPQSLGVMTHLVDLMVEDTKVSALPDSVEEWWQGARESTKRPPPRASLHGSPYCRNSPSTMQSPYQIELCKSDFQSSLGFYAWDIILPQRQL